MQYRSRLSLGDKLDTLGDVLLQAVEIVVSMEICACEDTAG